jgi:hypothetical protein
MFNSKAIFAGIFLLLFVTLASAQSGQAGATSQAGGGALTKLSAVLSALAVLSLGTERLTEAAKNLFPGWLAIDRPDPKQDAHRALWVKLIAIVIGTFMAHVTGLAASLDLTKDSGWAVSFALGAMASSGSGLWNSALDIVRQINTRSQALTDTVKAGGLQGLGTPPSSPINLQA